MPPVDATTAPIAIRRVFDPGGEASDQPATVPPTVASVAAIMTRTVYCVRPEVGVDVLARLFLDHGVSGFPVVDEAGRPIGVVTKTDLLRHLHVRGADVPPLPADDEAVLARLGGGVYQLVLDDTTVRDLMMPVVFAIAHDQPVARAAALMADERVHRLPVLDDHGGVCGILSSLDIARWVADLAGLPRR